MMVAPFLDDEGLHRFDSTTEEGDVTWVHRTTNNILDVDNDRTTYTMETVPNNTFYLTIFRSNEQGEYECMPVMVKLVD